MSLFEIGTKIRQEREYMRSSALVYGHDENGKRNDVHRPSLINPGDYEYQHCSVNRKDEIKGGPAGTCHHCGKAIVWEVVWKHLPTGNLVTFGWICTEILEMSNDRIAHEMVLLKRATENERRKLKWDEQRQLRNEEMRAAFPDLCEFLDTLDTEYEPLYVVKNYKWGYDKYGSLREWEITKLQNILDARKAYIERLLNEPTPTVDLMEGKYTLNGEVLTVKWQDGTFPGYKMLVMLDDANKVWGTVPKALNPDNLKGKRIEFSATVKQKQGDAHFGYFSRPTQAKVEA